MKPKQPQLPTPPQQLPKPPARQKLQRAVKAAAKAMRQPSAGSSR